jgi:nucleoside phosphorylase
MGTNSAAVAATALLADYPTVEDILLVGIAGGVPNLRAAKERHRGVTDHVRKGDIVVSEQVVQYDLVKMEEDRTENRSKGVAPSARLLNALNQLEQGIERGQRPWETIIDEVSKRSNWRRPRTDLLFDFAEKPKKRIQHPKTLRTGFPQVHRGPIGSANILLKSHSLRDALRDKFNIRAVEMEASGVADAAWNFAVGYITIRGVCDYCDASKDDAWQRYAALVAAAFARSLIARLPVS